MPNHICPRCHITFNKMSTYKYHVYKRKRPCVKLPSPNSSPNSSPKPSPKFICHKCNRSYANKSNLNKHTIRFHYEKQQYKTRTSVLNISDNDITSTFNYGKTNVKDVFTDIQINDTIIMSGRMSYGNYLIFYINTP